MPVRGGEHLAEAKKDRASSFFSACFPSIHSSRAASRTKWGHFESLRQIIFAGFDAKSDTAKRLDKAMSGGGLLMMSDSDMDDIKSSNKEGLTELQKHHQVVAYLFELGYDLALSSRFNVSRNPGFELGDTGSE